MGHTRRNRQLVGFKSIYFVTAVTRHLSVSRDKDRQTEREGRRQWRSKALRGPGSTVTWGPPFPSLPLPPLSPSPFPPLPQLSPSLCREAAPNPAEPQPKSNLVHFSLKIRHLVARILMIFLRVLRKLFLWPHYSGGPRSSGPRFIEPP